MYQLFSSLFRQQCLPLRSSLLALLLIFLSPRSFAQFAPAAQIDSLLQTNLPRPFSGVLAIATEGKIRFSGTYGFADRKKKRPVRAGNQFATGSISKQITAVLVLRAMEQGRLELHLPVRAYLPKYPASWADTVTLHHLLSHTSGVVGPDEPLAFSPGSRFSYANFGYELLGQILEQCYGSPYTKQANQLFRDCGMRHTRAPGNRRMTKWIPGYTEEADGTFTREKNLGQRLRTPSGGIVSTAADLVRWNVWLHGGKLLQPDTYEALIHRHTERQHRWGTLGYGYGIQIDQFDGIGEISHSGYVPGFISTLIYYPDTKTSLVILENVAWNSDDMVRVFFFHDVVRKLLRDAL